MSSNFWGKSRQNIDIQKAKQSFIEDFKYITSLGYITSHRKHNTGIGKTLEDLLEIEENNLSLPDYRGCIELKSQRAFTSSMLSIFTKSPTFPNNANNLIRTNYGQIDLESGKKIIHTTIKCSSFNNYKNTWGFKLKFDDENGKLYLIIKNLITKKIEKFKPYWDYQELQKKVSTKCSLIAYITAMTRTIDQEEQFHFQKAILLSGLVFQKFLDCLKNDKIFFDIRIGVYRSGKNKGKTHDHGSGFRVRKRDIEEVFDIEEITPDDLNKIKNKRRSPTEIQKRMTDFGI